MPGAVEVSVALVDLLGAAAFAYIAFRLAGLTKSFEADPRGPAAFTLLALAQVLASVAALGGGRASYTAYVATASFTLAGFLVLLPGSRRQYSAVPFTLLLPLGFDLAAAAAALAASLGFRGPARIMVSLIGASFLVRTMGLTVMPSPLGEMLLIVGEIMRGLVATMLAVLYAALPGGR